MLKRMGIYTVFPKATDGKSKRNEEKGSFLLSPKDKTSPPLKQEKRVLLVEIRKLYKYKLFLGKQSLFDSFNQPQIYKTDTSEILPHLQTCQHYRALPSQGVGEG